MFTMITIRLLCSVLAVSMLGSVVGQDSDGFSEKAGTESPMDDNSQDKRNDGEAPVQLCGRIKVHFDTMPRGPTAGYGQIPWMVTILGNGTINCGGTIINDYWVLTGAGCLVESYYRPGPFTVVVGDYSLASEDEWEQTYEISEVFPHHDYSSMLGYNNIALIRIKPRCGHGIQFNDYVQPVCLPLHEKDPLDGERLTVSGWLPSWMYSDKILLIGSVPIIGHEKCYECAKCSYCSGKSLLQRDTICAGGQVFYNVNTGGPATSNIGGMHILSAIIHGGRGFPQADSCDVANELTSIVEHLYWIAVVIEYSSTDEQKIIPPRTPNA